MFTKRVIPCLDVHNGRVVKGVNFVNLRDAGDPVEIARAYDQAGADELEFLCGLPVEEAVKIMFGGKLKMLFVTDGGKGAKLYLADGRSYSCEGYKVNTIDTTGAGDSFFGGAIAQIMRLNLSADNLVNGKTDYGKILDFACKCGAYTTTGYGAIPAMGDRENIEKAVK